MTEVRDIITIRNDMSQIFQYNNPLFECFSTHAYYPPSVHARATEHWHEDLEFMYISQGEINCVVNGRSIHLVEGEGIFVNSKRIHSNSSIPGKTCSFYCAIIHPTLLSGNKYVEQNYIRPLTGANSFDFIKLTHNDWTGEIIDLILTLFENTPEKGLELAIISGLYKIFHTVSLHYEVSSIIPGVNSIQLEAFRSMITYVQTNYASKVSLDDIAASGNVGKTLCAKLFKKYASKTPGEYLIHYRIQKSLELLSDTDKSTTEIGYLTGFSSASHFTKTFHDEMGITPANYRKNINSRI